MSELAIPSFPKTCTEPSILSQSTSSCNIFQKGVSDWVVLLKGMGEGKTQIEVLSGEEELQLEEINQDKKTWTQEENNLLLELHNELGNKWTAIALRLPGRTHNSIKNHFYGDIRKSLRRLNHFIRTEMGDKFKQLNINHISKMITIYSDRDDVASFNQAKNDQIQQLTKYLFEIGKKSENDCLTELQLAEMRKNITFMNEMLEKIKKLNTLKFKKGKRSTPNKLSESQEMIPKLKTLKQSQCDTNNSPTVSPMPNVENSVINNMGYYYFLLYPQNQWVNSFDSCAGPLQQSFFVAEEMFRNS